MINLCIVYSVIENRSSVIDKTSEVVNSLLDSIPNLNLIEYCSSPEEFINSWKPDEDNLGTIILNTSGGTEAIIEEITKTSIKPVLVLADSQRNSFASSLEAYATLKEKHLIKIYYADTLTEKVKGAKSFSSALSALQKVNESHFCLIGEPSDWLLTSKDFTDFSPFKTKFTKVSLDQLTSKVEEISDERVSPLVGKWKSDYEEVLVKENSLIDSAKVYNAIKMIVDENDANVISIRCFDLLDRNYTACMGLSICNDEGITAGCEGDIPTTFTMMIAQQISGQPVWMANPSSINKEKNQITFAHCTVPSKFLTKTKKAGLTTHMESGKSTAISGPLQKTGVTILRIGNDFNKIVAVTGRIVETDMKNMNLCRTQAVINIDCNVEDWVEASLGNHHVIVYGDITPELKYFCDFSGVELISL